MDKDLIQIPDENIHMSFHINDQEYIVLSESQELNEGDDIYFAKRDRFHGGNSIIRSIESDEEYNSVINKYDEIINAMEENEYE